jgi:membrane protease subunit HflC
MKRNLTIVVGGLLLLIFILLLFCFQVRTTEVAVVTTWGKATRTIQQPGAYPRWPYPIEKVHKFDKRIYNFESKFEQVPTSDQYSLLIMVYAGWNIGQPELFFPRFNGSIRQAEENLEGVVRNACNGVVGKHPFSHFISADEKELKFVQIENEILERIKQDTRDAGYGINVEFVGIKQLKLPESVTERVFERMQAEQNRLEKAITAEGTRLAENIKSAARLQSNTLLAEADANATHEKTLGWQKATAAFDVYRTDPKFAEFLLRLNGIENVLGERTTLILDQDLQLFKPQAVGKEK